MQSQGGKRKSYCQAKPPWLFQSALSAHVKLAWVSEIIMSKIFCWTKWAGTGANREPTDPLHVCENGLRRLEKRLTDREETVEHQEPALTVRIVQICEVLTRTQTSWLSVSVCNAQITAKRPFSSILRRNQQLLIDNNACKVRKRMYFPASPLPYFIQQ